MAKRGLFGKIFLIIGIVILLVLGFVAYTIYQVVSFVGLAKDEMPLLQSDLQNLGQGDCDSAEGARLRLNKIKSEAENACGNPLIRWGVGKVEGLPVNCDSLDEQFNSSFDLVDFAEEGCENF